MKTNNIIADLTNLLGAEVSIFGQPRTLNSEIDELTVDAREIFKTLAEHEVDYYISRYDEENEDYEDEEVDTVDEYLEWLEETFGLTEIKHDNTYNYNANISNHLDYQMFESNGEYYVSVKAHRYGDVRCNYTEEALYKFDNEYQFFECFYECDKFLTVEVNGREFDCRVSALSETVEVTEIGDDNNCSHFYVCDMEELKERIAEEM